MTAFSRTAIKRAALSVLFSLSVLGCRQEVPPEPSPVTTFTVVSEATATPTEPENAAVLSEAEFDYEPYLADSGYENLTDEFQFPPVQQGEVVTHTFELRNLDSAELVLGEIRTTSVCCVKAEVANENLLAGSSTELTVTFESVHRGGPFFANIVVPYRSDADEQGAFLYRLVGDVKAVMSLEPGFLELEAEQADFLLRSERFRSGLEITSIESDIPGAKVTDGEVKDDFQSFSLDVSSAKGDQGVIRLLTNDADVPDMLLGWKRKS